MGQIFQVLDGKGVVTSVERPGCWIEVLRAGKQPVTSLCKLELDLHSPLSPRTLGFKKLPSKPATRWTRAGSVQADPPDVTFELGDGVWWCSVQGHSEQYFVANGDGLRIVTKGQAYCALGAVEHLQAMGLDDAAIALSAGQFDLASVQLIADRERRAAER